MEDLFEEYSPANVAANHYINKNVAQSKLYNFLPMEFQKIYKEELREAHLAGRKKKEQEIIELKDESSVIIDEIFNCLPNCDELSPKIIYEAKEKIKDVVVKIYTDKFNYGDDINGVVDKYKQEKLDKLMTKALLLV